MCAPGFDFQRLFAATDSKTKDAVIAEMMQGRQVQPGEITLITRSGDKFDTIFHVKSITYDNNQAVLVTFTDITERKLAEQELAERMRQIERFNEFAVGRELEMLHLKEEVNSLLEKLGRKKKYKAPDRVRQEGSPDGSPVTSQGEGNESTE